MHDDFATYVKKVLSGPPDGKVSFFAFDVNDPVERIVLKFNLWSRHFFPKYFKQEDDDFHNTIDTENTLVYVGTKRQYVNIAFRGAAKTTRTKLFIAFAILNDTSHFRKYFKVLSKDFGNSKQITTDIYNMMVAEQVARVYPTTFVKSDAKREETMSAFTTSFGVRITAETVGTDQRGALSEDSRPDFLWFEDFETRASLNSLVTTKTIWENMDEAKSAGSLSPPAGLLYTCNYISEMGNVHKLVEKGENVHIIPITKDGTATGEPRWYFKRSDIEYMQKDDLDFEGERLCKPSASLDVFFDREVLNKMEMKSPYREVAGFRMYYKYDPSHRYASGHDISGGVGLDSSTSVFIDFSTIPARVVATYDENTIKPDIFGDEISKQGDYYGRPMAAPEANNYGHTTILRLRQLDVPLFEMTLKATDKKRDQQSRRKEYGWHTNALTKPQMLYDLRKAVSDGLLVLSDPRLIKEAKSYTRNDLMDTSSAGRDPRLSTRHFDLLIAAAIAWQMRDHAEISKPIEKDREEEDVVHYSGIGI